MIALPERLTHREAEATLQQLCDALDRQQAGEPWGVDVAPLRQFDSSALVVLLGLRRHADARGQVCRLTGVPPRLGQLAQVYGVRELLALDAASPSAAQPPVLT
ncbi:MAG: STAS domain-containing protein [Burkholderiaceae bacterium]|nr:STAS domain-containing protein [Burkholderiaceae bacterium]